MESSNSPELVFDKLTNHPYYLYDGKLHDLETGQTVAFSPKNRYSLTHITAIDTPFNTRIKDHPIFVVTSTGWMIYSSLGNFIYKIAESGPEASNGTVNDVIPFKLLSNVAGRVTSWGGQHNNALVQQLLTQRIPVSAPTFINFNEVANKIRSGDIIRYSAEPEIKELSITGNPIFSFVDRNNKVYLVEVRYDPSTNSISPATVTF